MSLKFSAIVRSFGSLCIVSEFDSSAASYGAMQLIVEVL